MIQRKSLFYIAFVQALRVRPFHWALLFPHRTVHFSRQSRNDYSDQRFERTKVTIIPSKTKISHETPIQLIGSCFSDNMSSKLYNLKFNVTSNPFVTLYNPISIKNSILRIVSGIPYEPKDLFDDRIEAGVYHSWDHHSSFSSENSSQVLERINSRLLSSHNHFQNCKFLFITLGTCQIHTLNDDNNRVVANCHKRKLLCFHIMKMNPSTVQNPKMISCNDTMLSLPKNHI